MRRQREYMLERRAAERNEGGGAGREGGNEERQVTLAWVGRGALAAGQITPDLGAVVVVPSGNNGHRSRAEQCGGRTDGQVGTVRALVRPPAQVGFLFERAARRPSSAIGFASRAR